MEPVKVLKRISEYYPKIEKDIIKNISKGKYYVQISFLELSQHCPDLSEELLENPEEVIRGFELHIKEREDKNIKVLFGELPSACHIKIRNIRSKHLDKFWLVEGMVKRKTDVRPQITSIRFECPSCGNIIPILQLEKKITQPSKCSCGRKGSFKTLSRELKDGYAVVLEEFTEYVKAGSELKQINCFISGTLTEPKLESKIFPGVKIKICGIIKSVYIDTRSGAKKTQLDIYMDVNNVIILDEDFDDIEITEEDKEEFREMVKSEDVLSLLAQSMFGDIEGYDKIKKGLILSMIGGEQKILPSGSKARGDIHCLLVGDPGAGKSGMLKLAYANTPKGRYVSGKGASAAGLTATVVRDELVGGYALEAGALPLTNNGTCYIDELDKMTENETSALHEALEEQTVSISKANIQATLKAETTVVAAANPKFGRFDIYEPLSKQIELPPALITRFDLIFVFLDKPDTEKDTRLAKKVLSRYRLVNPPIIPRDKIKRFLAYAKQFHPVYDNKIEQIIIDFYVSLRNRNNKESIPISPRYIEVIRRLAEANAKINLREKIIKQDVQIALDVVMYCLKKIATDPQTGQLDMDMVDTGISSANRSKRQRFLRTLDELSRENKEMPHEDIVEKGIEEGLRKEEITEIIKKALRNGEMYEIRPGYYIQL